MKKLVHSALFSSLALFVFFQSEKLIACAVCGAGDTDATRNAFSMSTAFLSFIPLIAIGGVIYTVYRFAKNNDAQS